MSENCMFFIFIQSLADIFDRDSCLREKSRRLETTGTQQHHVSLTFTPEKDAEDDDNDDLVKQVFSPAPVSVNCAPLKQAHDNLSLLIISCLIVRLCHLIVMFCH